MTELLVREAAAAPAEDLAHCDDTELLGLVRSLPLGDQRRSAACEMLVARYQPLVRSCARKYWNGPESADELMQVGYVGLMKAINKFDPAVGGSLAAYAFPSISGELKRHFRDRVWAVHVPRSVHDLATRIGRVSSELTAKLGRAVQLAAQSGNDDTAKLLASVVDVEDPATGTVRLKARVNDADEMALDTRSTKTVRVKK